MGKVKTSYRIEEASQYGTIFKSVDEASKWADDHFPPGYTYKLEKVVSEHTVLDVSVTRSLQKRLEDEIKLIIETADSTEEAANSIMDHLYEYLKEYN